MKYPPTHTTRHTALSAADFMGVDLIVAAHQSTEDRGHLDLWRDIADSDPLRVAWLTPQGLDSVSVANGPIQVTVDLNDNSKIEALMRNKNILIDISGLGHATWAPFFHAAYSLQLQTKVVYAEPDRYREHANPISASRFDLSITLEGLAPLPGFARLSGPADEGRCIFVAMLGFEGNRPECLALQIEPTPRVVPVVGVPGFQIEYPSFTVACNRRFLDEYRGHSNIRYARASCPFEAFSVLKEIHRDFPEHYLYIAPVGTKPHALGSIWYALEYPNICEIMFDNPIRKPGRTAGVGVIHVYQFGNFNGS